MLITKKTADRRGLSIHDGAGSAVSAFARRQLEKMGWSEGKGLGKNEDGLSTHIKVHKKDDSTGLGIDTAIKQESAVAENWWHDGFSKQLKAFGGGVSDGKKVKKSKGKRKLEDAGIKDAPPTYDELFAATGGARLGMRARAKQPGKIARAEQGLATSIVELTEVDDSAPNAKKAKRVKETVVIETVEIEIVVNDAADEQTSPKKKDKKKDKKKGKEKEKDKEKDKKKRRKEVEEETQEPRIEKKSKKQKDRRSTDDE